MLPSLPGSPEKGWASQEVYLWSQQKPGFWATPSMSHLSISLAAIQNLRLLSQALCSPDQRVRAVDGRLGPCLPGHSRPRDRCLANNQSHRVRVWQQCVLRDSDQECLSAKGFVGEGVPKKGAFHLGKGKSEPARWRGQLRGQHTLSGSKRGRARPGHRAPPLL